MNISRFLESFRRITSGGKYIPETDGLRFIAIFWVVVVMHLVNIIDKNLCNGQLISHPYLRQVISEGGHGVSLFFMISGFIVILPFIREKLYRGKPVSLKQYYLRRVTRLEPPYLVVLTISFILLVFVVKKYSFSYLFPHYGASAAYLHSTVYDAKSPVLEIAWSLEVEVQFYIVAPLFSLLFLIKNHLTRRLLLSAAIVLSGWYYYENLWINDVFLPHFLCYFLSGILFADFYCDPNKILFNSVPATITGLLLLVGLPLMISLDSLTGFMGKLVLMNIFFYLAFANHVLARILRIQWITIIGGMCYSIYLLHLMVMAAVTWALRYFSFTSWPVLLYALVLLLAVLVISAVFFRLVEQPCMKRNWYRRIFKRQALPDRV